MNISKMYRFGLLHLFLLTIIILLNRHIVSGQTRVTNNNSNESVVKETKINDNKNNFRNAKSTNTPYKELLSCAITLDGRCFLDQSENLLRFHYHKLWVEADSEAMFSSRATPETLPSKLMENIPKLFNRITELMSHGVTGLFRDAKENDADDDELIGKEDIEDNEDDVNGIEEGRGKKKKKRKAIIKLLVVGAVLAAKLSLLLKVLALKIQLKFLVIAVLSLLLNGARFFYDLKKGHQPQKVVYYEHAQHQHHYDHEDEWGGGGHWDRSLNTEDEDKKVEAQEIAYSKYRPYRPTYNLVNNKPNYSWDDEKK